MHNNTVEKTGFDFSSITLVQHEMNRGFWKLEKMNKKFEKNLKKIHDKYHKASRRAKLVYETKKYYNSKLMSRSLDKPKHKALKQPNKCKIEIRNYELPSQAVIQK